MEKKSYLSKKKIINMNKNTMSGNLFDKLKEDYEHEKERIEKERKEKAHIIENEIIPGIIKKIKDKNKQGIKETSIGILESKFIDKYNDTYVGEPLKDNVYVQLIYEYFIRENILISDCYLEYREDRVLVFKFKWAIPLSSVIKENSWRIISGNSYLIKNEFLLEENLKNSFKEIGKNQNNSLYNQLSKEFIETREDRVKKINHYVYKNIVPKIESENKKGSKSLNFILRKDMDNEECIELIQAFLISEGIYSETSGTGILSIEWSKSYDEIMKEKKSNNNNNKKKDVTETNKLREAYIGEKINKLKNSKVANDVINILVGLLLIVCDIKISIGGTNYSEVAKILLIAMGGFLFIKGIRDFIKNTKNIVISLNNINCRQTKES